MEAFGAETAVSDIAIIDGLSEARPRAVQIYRPTGEPRERVDLKVFSWGRQMPLSERVPLLEHMGFRVVSERTFEVAPGPDGTSESGARIWLHDTALVADAPNGADPLPQRAMEALLEALFDGRAESDGYNALVLAAGAEWRDVALLRTLSRYLQQVRAGFPQDYLAGTMVRNAPVAMKLIALAYARFNPDHASAESEQSVTGEIDALLQSVASLDEDRILRRFRNLIQAAVRTNFFQQAPGGGPAPSSRSNSRAARSTRCPSPARFTKSPSTVPALRASTCASARSRAGPALVGQAAGFPHRDSRSGEGAAGQERRHRACRGERRLRAQAAATARQPRRLDGGRHCAYKIFVGALLDLTDNLDGAAVLPPAATVRHDGDDPYLVVAADKGTATFSDIANGCRSSTGTGSAMPSRQAGRLATITKKWALPRVARGRP